MIRRETRVVGAAEKAMEDMRPEASKESVDTAERMKRFEIFGVDEAGELGCLEGERGRANIVVSRRQLDGGGVVVLWRCAGREPAEWPPVRSP